MQVNLSDLPIPDLDFVRCDLNVMLLNCMYSYDGISNMFSCSNTMI